MRYNKWMVLYCCALLSTSCAKKSLQGASSTSASAATEEVRVLSYNIHHANPPSRPDYIDIAAIANVIKQQQPDIVALQEIDVNTERSGKTVDEAKELARLTGMQSYFSKGIDYQGGEYGIAVLSRFPMEGMKRIPLPTDEATKGEPRTLGTVVIKLPKGHKMVFAFTHLDAQRAATNRLLQIRKITEVLQSEQLPVVIAGDFNAAPGSDVINILDDNFTRTCLTGCGFTIPVENPNKTIDFIAYKPSANFTVVEHKVINEKYASDHLPVLAVLKIK
jgi:endonuclease/exonuclease/phosphatase family metal-dependent hydrolase